MKNKIIIIIFGCILLNINSYAKEFTFNTKNLEIFDSGNFISGGKGYAVTADNELKINADKFEYTDETKILKTFGNGLLVVRSKNLEIKFDNLFVDQLNSLIKGDGNIKILDKVNNLIIYCDSLIYDQKKQSIKALKNVLISNIDNKLLIETDEIVYNQKKNIIESNVKTLIKDNENNNYKVDKFSYEITNSLLKVNNLHYRDNQNNTLITSLAYINTDSNRLFGKDVIVNLDNKSFNENNEPRIKGVSVINEVDTTKINKGVFTTCKKRDKCPPWQLSSELIEHDKKNKVINYKNAVLSVYDVPVLYFPKFFHPDPTVKRQSGFLVPSIKNAVNSSDYLNTPYFLAISENKDATFSPRFYAEDKFFLQTEFRQANFNSNHFIDTSYFGEKDNSNKSHFFYEFDKNIEIKNFENNSLSLKIQKTSNDTYLKKNKIKSDIITDEDILENSFNLDLFSNDLSVNIEATAYEDLNKKSSDRYDYILPKIDLVKKLKNRTNFGGNFLFKSQNLIRNYNTNIFEKSNINDLIFSSYPKVTQMGFYNNYELVLKNSNTDSKNSLNFKNGRNMYFSSLFQFNSSLPLIRESNKYQKILKPKLSLKIAPKHTKNDVDDNPKIDVNNIFSLNRTTDNDAIEGGVSIIYGTDYVINNKDNGKDLLNLKLANNLRFDKNDDLPSNYQIGEKTSNFFNEIKYAPNKFFNIKYNSSIKNNLSDISSENLITEFSLNNLVTTFDYLNENNTSDQNSYLTSSAKFILDESNSLSFSTRENKTADLTEYYKFMYQYKNDCLAASLEYNKEYYSDRDIKPDESIFFKLTIIPFGETTSPNLKN